jgi:hypothetical protein
MVVYRVQHTRTQRAAITWLTSLNSTLMLRRDCQRGPVLVARMMGVAPWLGSGIWSVGTLVLTVAAGRFPAVHSVRSGCAGSHDDSSYDETRLGEFACRLVGVAGEYLKQRGCEFAPGEVAAGVDMWPGNDELAHLNRWVDP